MCLTTWRKRARFRLFDKNNKIFKMAIVKELIKGLRQLVLCRGYIAEYVKKEDKMMHQIM